MTREALLKKITSNIYGLDSEKKVFYDYLSGSTDYELKQYTFKMYSCFIEFEDYEEHKDIVTRFFTSLSNKMPDMLLNIMRDKNNRYKMYYYMNLEINFVKKDILKKENIYKIRGNLKTIKDFYINMYSELTLYYRELLDEIINNCLSYQDENKFIISTILFAYKINFHDKSYINKLNEFETIVFSLLNKAFKLNDIQYALNKYIDDKEVIEYCNNFVPLNKNINLEDAKHLLFFLCNLCFKKSKLIKSAARISMMIFYPDYIERRLGNIEDRLKLLELYKLPQEVYLKYFLYEVLFFSNLNHKKKFIEMISSILKKSFDIYIDVLNNMIENNDICFIPLLSILLKENKNDFNKCDSSYYLEKAENIIIENANKLSEIFKIKHFNQNEVKHFNQNEIIDFNLLKDRDFNYKNVIGHINYNQKELILIILSSISLLNYSKVASNFITVILNLSYEGVFNRLNFFQNYDFFNNIYDENIYSILFYKVNIPFEIIIKVYFMSYYYENNQKVFNKEKEFISFLKMCKTKAEETITNNTIDNQVLICYLNFLYKNDNGFNLKNIVKAFERKNKSVAECIEKIVLDKEEEIRPLIENFINEKSKIISDTVVRLIRRWDNEKIEEKLNKINNISELMEYVEISYTKSNEKHIPYLKELNYNCIRLKDCEEFACEKIVKFYISEYIMLKEMYLIKTCQKIQQFLNLDDLRNLIKSIIELWTIEDLSTKYKNIILPFCLVSDETHINEIKEQIDFFTSKKKPSLASFTVKALCMSENKMFISLVDSISQKYRNSKVRKTAEEALEMTAFKLGITREELNDLIIPNLNFDKNGDRYFNYGKREFRVHIDQNLKISIFNQNKKITSLPKASKKFNDDENLVLNAKEQLKYIKKQLDLIFKYQKDKIFNYIISCRKWKKDKWEEIFINNPIMKQFAINLIWEETDENNNIIQTFRYMEDGTFNISNEEEYILNNNSYIMLLHPADIENNEILKWKQQLEDYEIIQPVEQINLPIYNIDNEKGLKTEISLFEGTELDGLKFKKVASKYNLKSYFNSNWDYCGCLYTDKNYGIVFIINTDGNYCENKFDEMKTIKQIKFFNLKEDLSFYEESHELMLKDVPMRLLSFSIFAAKSIIEEILK